MIGQTATAAITAGEVDQHMLEIRRPDAERIGGQSPAGGAGTQPGVMATKGPGWNRWNSPAMA